MPMNVVKQGKRKQLGFIQEQVAEHLHVSAPAVSKWETCKQARIFQFCRGLLTFENRFESIVLYENAKRIAEKSAQMSQLFDLCECSSLVAPFAGCICRRKSQHLHRVAEKAA